MVRRLFVISWEASLLDSSFLSAIWAVEVPNLVSFRNEVGQSKRSLWLPTYSVHALVTHIAYPKVLRRQT
jgi:hypothetical protein